MTTHIARIVQIVCLCALFCVSLPTHAQMSMDTKWYWATIPADDQLIAFTADGETNVLMNEVYPFKLRRVDDQTAVVMGRVGETYGAYVVDATSATLVSTFYDQSDIGAINPMVGPPGVEAAALVDDFILIWSKDYGAFVFDGATGQSVRLDVTALDAVRVSEDGRFVRYRSDYQDWDDPYDLHWALYEYDVLAATTRTVYSRDETVPMSDRHVSVSCTPDRYGERWYCITSLGREEADGMRISDAAMITLDGQARAVPDEYHLKEALNGDWYFMTAEQYYNHCRVGCSFQILSEHGALVNTFTVPDTLPTDMSLNIIYSRVLDSKRVLIDNRLGAGTMFILSADGQLTYLGTVPCSPCLGASPDGRWQVLYDVSEEHPPGTFVWDLLNQTLVVEHDWVSGGYEGYVENGVTLSPSTYYSILDAREYELDFGILGTLIDLLPGGVFVYGVDDTYYERLPTGIYRYTFGDEDEKLLIPGGRLIDYRWQPGQGI